MAYCDQDDLENQLSEEELIELTDDAGSGSVDATVLARAIADADAEIDSYCSIVYSVPFSTVPDIIRKVSVDISIYNLYSRRQFVVPEERKDRYERAVQFLADVAKGMASLGGDAPSQSDSGLPESTTSKDDRIYTIGRDSDSTTGTLDNY